MRPTPGIIGLERQEKNGDCRCYLHVTPDTHTALLHPGVPGCLRPLRQNVVLFFLRFYLFIFLEREGREKERERNINVWLPLMCPLLGTWPTTQACALTGN